MIRKIFRMRWISARMVCRLPAALSQPKNVMHRRHKLEAYIHASEENIEIIQSPVGMPGRALRNKFIDRVKRASCQSVNVTTVWKKCSPQKVPYCITKALIDAVRGDVENGLVFCGANTGRIHEITTVHHLMQELAGDLQ